MDTSNTEETPEMKTLFNEPKTASQAAFICRIIARAESLLSEGYRFQQMGNTPWYAIFKPENDSLRNCDRDYKVDLTPGKECCTCDGFAEHKDCKHRIAVQLETEREAAQVEQLEAEYNLYAEAGY